MHGPSVGGAGMQAFLHTALLFYNRSAKDVQYHPCAVMCAGEVDRTKKRQERKEESHTPFGAVLLVPYAPI